MKNKFKGFYTPKESINKSIWNDKHTVFVFDANCLLNLYRCESETREDIFSVMEKLSERSWFPFQTCFEYQRNRITVIADSVKNINAIKKTLAKITSQADNALSSHGVKKQLYSRLSDRLKEFKEKLNQPIEEFLNSELEPRIIAINEISKSDFIRTRIDKIVGDNCGDIPPQDEIDVINKEGNARYENEIPPGFEDRKKEGRSHYNGIYFTNKFGDLYLWKEIIEHSKNEFIKNVIFITDDHKPDWWFIPETNKPKGPLEALQTEIYTESGIENFKLVTQSTFLYEASKYLTDVNIKDSSVEEIEMISKSHYNDLFDENSISEVQAPPLQKFDYDMFFGRDIKARESVTSPVFENYDLDDEDMRALHSYYFELDEYGNNKRIPSEFLKRLAIEIEWEAEKLDSRYIAWADHYHAVTEVEDNARAKNYLNRYHDSRSQLNEIQEVVKQINNRAIIRMRIVERELLNSYFEVLDRCHRRINLLNRFL